MIAALPDGFDDGKVPRVQPALHAPLQYAYLVFCFETQLCLQRGALRLVPLHSSACMSVLRSVRLRHVCQDVLGDGAHRPRPPLVSPVSAPSRLLDCVFSLVPITAFCVADWLQRRAWRAVPRVGLLAAAGLRVPLLHRAPARPEHPRPHDMVRFLAAVSRSDPRRCVCLSLSGLRQYNALLAAVVCCQFGLVPWCH